MFGFFKSKQKKDMEFMQSLVTAAGFRDSLDNILSSYSVEIDGDDEDKLVHEVIGVSKLIAEEAVKRSGRTLNQLTDDEMYICMLIGFVSSNHISRLAEVDFELTSTVVCSLLAEHMSPEKIGQLIREVIDGHNQMVGRAGNAKVLQAIGNQVSEFFSSADEAYLNKLSELYLLMAKNIG